MPTAAQLSRLAQVSKAAAKIVRDKQAANTKAVTLRTYEFTVVNEAGALKPKDEAALKRFPRWKELNLVVRGAGQDPKERFFATDVHFKQRSTLKSLPTSGPQPSEKAKDDLDWYCVYVDCSLNRFHALEDSLLELPELRGLDFSTNLLTNLNKLQLLRNIQYLDCSNNMVTDVSALAKCPSLVQIDLSFNSIETLNVDFRPMVRLVILRLNGNKIRDLYPLHSLPAIRFLELQDNVIKDLRPLGEIATLMHLDVARNQLTENACVCAGLRKLKKLASLILQGNPFTSLTGYRYETFDASDSLKTLDHVRITKTIRRAIDEAKRKRSMEELTRFLTNEYQGRIEHERERVEAQNARLRVRQKLVQDDFDKVKTKLEHELDDCIQYLQRLRLASAKPPARATEPAPSQPLVQVINNQVKRQAGASPKALPPRQNSRSPIMGRATQKSPSRRYDDEDSGSEDDDYDSEDHESDESEEGEGGRPPQWYNKVQRIAEKHVDPQDRYLLKKGIASPKPAAKANTGPGGKPPPPVNSRPQVISPSQAALRKSPSSPPPPSRQASNASARSNPPSRANNGSPAPAQRPSQAQARPSQAMVPRSPSQGPPSRGPSPGPLPRAPLGRAPSRAYDDDSEDDDDYDSEDGSYDSEDDDDYDDPPPRKPAPNSRPSSAAGGGSRSASQASSPASSGSKIGIKQAAVVAQSVSPVSKGKGTPPPSSSPKGAAPSKPPTDRREAMVGNKKGPSLMSSLRAIGKLKIRK